MKRIALVVMAACARPPAVLPVSPPAPPAAPAPAAVPAPVSPWAAVPVRVMTWTPHGVQQIGALPGALPQPMPALWYVEPIRRLDEATFARLVELVRSDRVPGLSLRGQPVARWLAGLRDLPDLRALILDGTDVDGAALAALQLPLIRLYLAGTAIDDAAVAAIAERYPALEALDLEDTAIGDSAAHAIAGLRELRALNLSGTRITDDGGAALSPLAHLEIIDLGSTRAGGKTVAALRQLPVHELFLDRTRVRAEVATLASLAPALVRFDISSTAHHPTDPELAWLANAPNLVEVGISGAKVHDPLALAIARLPHLREVRMAETAITSATIQALAARSDLEEVDLADTPVDNVSAGELLSAPEMRIARFDGAPVGDAALSGPLGSKLVELYLSRTPVTDRGTQLFDSAPPLTALGLGHTLIGDATIARVAKLTQLRVLVLSAARAQPESLVQLGALTELERLYLDQVHVDDSVIAALAPARDHLRVLHLAGSDVSEAGLPALRALSALEELTLGDSRMHAGIADLSAWPRLHTLSLVGLELHDSALPSIATATSLTVLDLSATEIRDPSPLAALPHLRTLGVAQNHLSAAGIAALKRLAARGVEIVR